jgi:phosphatidylinositol alpha-1,6-mannosyltransferase
LAGTHGLRCQLTSAWSLFTARKRLRDATVLLAEPGPMLAAMWLLPLGNLLPRRLMLTFHGSEILRFHRNPLLRWLTRALIRRSVRISTLTHFTRDLLCSRFPEAAGKTILTPGAIRAVSPHGPPVTPDPDNIPEVAIKADRLVVLTVGRLHPRKGQLITLQALDALPPALRARVEYWIVGKAGDSHYAHLLHLAALHATVRTRFLGELNETQLELAYDQADVFALTSIDYRQSVEGFGLVYLDASARGLPIVAHRVGGVPEAVADDVTGLLVSPGHPAELTAAFVRLLNDAALRARLGAAGRTWARQNSWQQAAESLFGPGDATIADGLRAPTPAP